MEIKIVSVSAHLETFRLTRPYAIAFKSSDTASNVILSVELDDGNIGMGAGSPEEFVTGETIDQSEQALSLENLSWLIGRELDDFESILAELQTKLAKTPAARAAVEIALFDLRAKAARVPLVKLFGEQHTRLPTSITIGIKGVAETLAEADEYLSRQFKILKVKLGNHLDEDIDRINALRKHVGRDIKIRVDVNQGYELSQFNTFVRATADADVEFYEQPIQVAIVDQLLELDAELAQKVALDECLLDEKDAARLVSPKPLGGIFNIKLMKAGGISTARKIAAVAAREGLSLMWGCMDESRISIAAALHVAFSCKATKYLDLDGHLDLDHDVVSGGFVLEDGYMRLTNAYGLGVEKLEDPRN